ncbi:cobalt-precorrin-5B (C(1))-methyltransferase [Agrobacterium vitis]|uniref:Cobalt-precorrin-5B C(1)-methyltransferase n=1 Tax=Agrobacterium vitis TaxID=373 RepID=A0ABD6G7R8_AGRVI|nr:cobalt-precorrin-5B (C(1))-methyltransferase [Agrobacterium vitis]MUO77828.1 cobalt-precorrin-5B (C(1))-methyltransferase [Agrobacterium vitis]MUO93346.1 cobalt-precorrin-5B (C(1))-methyltransferase [Agrobacterium vitis]MUP04697.1 cobalt-precorrin-5B (C(1))-methyltransferase [Agrobacterium vitis]MUZ80866.1 cobalt-precorrin-5B (C(1))-methyltransferase [Agrobacterium vitis]MVA08949.1 cobalt-precorrin-5B (C(1))-methyltransferase [Agrobacterium vitis]
MTEAAPPTETPNAAASRKPNGPLRKGWTTGACATAATKAALTALLTGEFPDPVSIRLPGGQEPAFALAYEQIAGGQASAGIIKDAGDDPDVTHGATVIATIRRLTAGSGIRFVAGDGVGTVTRPGLPLAIGEPAINPVPRTMMAAEVEALAKQHGVAPDVEITISIPGGQALAEKTWNPRLGIIGGLSVLGTTGIVNPFSCAAWIHSIHRGIDVARAMGLPHVLGATGSTSERTAQQLYGLPQEALLDMGDFAGGLLKYLRQHPVSRLTIAGGFAKLSKLAQGALDLHSARSQIDNSFMETLMSDHPLSQDIKEKIRSANTALEILDITRQNNLDMATPIAQRARQTALSVLRGADIAVDVIVTDRAGAILAIAS